MAKIKSLKKAIEENNDFDFNDLDNLDELGSVEENEENKENVTEQDNDINNVTNNAISNSFDPMDIRENSIKSNNNIEDVFDVIIDPGFSDVDITDKTILQDQFNEARRNYYDLIKRIKDVYEEEARIRDKMSRMKAAYLSDASINNREVSNLLNASDEYLDLQIKLEAFEKTEKILSEQINFYKSDIRILQGSMYNRF